MENGWPQEGQVVDFVVVVVVVVVVVDVDVDFVCCVCLFVCLFGWLVVFLWFAQFPAQDAATLITSHINYSLVG